MTEAEKYARDLFIAAKSGPDPTDIEKYALERATDAAWHVAQRVSPTPVQASLEVMCAFLIAKEQLRRANKEAEPLTDDDRSARELAEIALKSTGFDCGRTPQTNRAMVLFGLPLLWRIRLPNVTDGPERTDAPRRGGVLRAVRQWIFRILS